MNITYRNQPVGHHYDREERDFGDRHQGHHEYHGGHRQSGDHHNHTPVGRDRYAAYGPSSRKPNVSLEDALHDLAQTLEEANRFFISFEQSFIEDTRRIKGYANDKLMFDLWSRKIRASNQDPRPPRGHSGGVGPSHHYPSDRQNGSDGSSFRSMTSRIRKHFEAALQVVSYQTHSRRERGRGVDSERLQRIAQRLELHYRDAAQLIEAGMRDTRAMKELTKELDLGHMFLQKHADLWGNGNELSGPQEEANEDGGGYSDGNGGGGGGDGGGGPEWN